MVNTETLVKNDVLPSWRAGDSKRFIVNFVDAVATSDSPDYVPPPERIAVFDNDGTLWAERPAYFQALFVRDRVEAMAVDHPEWRTEEPFASLLAGDVEHAMAGGKRALAELVMATHAGMTTDEFRAVARAWIATARHPTTGRPFTAMVYQPMLELLEYLRENGFATYIFSAGGIEFMRVWTEEVYGIPPDRVFGSSIETVYEVRDDRPVLVRRPALAYLDDGPGKPVAIDRHVGRRPLIAFGNSDGDREMLEWTAAGEGRRLAGYVHHTDAEREWAYDRGAHAGGLDRGLDQAKAEGWLLVDMHRDWEVVFPDQS